jgi:hypothetical protein
MWYDTEGAFTRRKHDELLQNIATREESSCEIRWKYNIKKYLNAVQFGSAAWTQNRAEWSVLVNTIMNLPDQLNF